MKTRKHFMLVIIMTLILALSGGIVAMAEGEASVSGSVSSASGCEGETVAVYLTVSGSNVSYLSGTVSCGGAEYYLTSGSLSGSTFYGNVSGSGSISATMHVEIPSGAEPGSSYPISLSCYGKDEEGNEVSGSGDSGSVTVEKRSVTNVSLSSSSLELKKGSSSKLSATVYPENATDKSVSWSTSDSSVATVDGGNVTAVGPGKATISAEADGVTASCAVTVISSVSGVSLNKNSLSLKDADTEQLTATVSPSDASNKNVSWTSSNSSVAKVSSSGMVTAVDPGNATITVKTSDGGFTDSCSVTVSALSVSSVSLNNSKLAMHVGDQESLKATVKPSGATNQSVSWSSSNSSVAAVSGGTVTAKKVGSATITVTTKDGGKTASCEVVVEPINVNKVLISNQTLNLEVGDSTTISASVTPSNATYQDITWSSSDSSIVRVQATGTNTARITALKETQKYHPVVITAKAADVNASTGNAASTTCRVTVEAPKVTGIAVNPSSLVLDVGDSSNLSATVSPSNADQSVTWSSSNSSVATVSSSGRVSAVGGGKATITATASDGKTKAKCQVTVNTKKVAVKGISLNRSSLTLGAGDTSVLRAVISPSNASNQSVTWSSSNNSVATVSGSGVVTGVSNGQATITARSRDGGYTATCTVNVQSVKVTGVSVDPKTIKTLYVGNTKTIRANISPNNASNQGVTWSSSDTKIATVNENGVVKGVKAGSVVITVKTNDGGFTDKCKVTVKNKPDTAILPTSLTLDRNELELVQGDKFILIANIDPEDATETVVLWSSSDENVATVSEEGVVEAVGPGTAVIAAKNTESGLSSTCVVTVLDPTGSSSANNAIIIGAVSAAVALGAAIALIVLKKKKKAAAE